MKVPVSWLKQFVEIDAPIDEFASKMIWLGNGVEGYDRLDEGIEKVVVGKILEMWKHPDADTLQVCRVDVGEKVIQVVTGAPNVKAGDLVPVALDGASLPGGKKIKKGKLRGEVSEGMLCSGPELEVPADLYPHCGDEGILILNEEYAPGAPIQPILGIDDTVIDFEVLANRPDCLSVLGVARESAVALGKTAGDVQVSVRESGGDVNEYVRISVQDEELCPRYCARVVRNIQIGPSPMWMRKALNACGIRPINNIVDITNYVMLELGQPMHAFDLRHVRGGHIIVRRAVDGEELRTLDGKDRVMKKETLVIADELGATGIAGVMGGEGSEIACDTTEVLFEAACFLGSSVRQTGRALGLRTEASGRFERGVNAHGVRKALDRAAQLVEELGAGEVVSGVIDVYPNPKASPVISVSCESIRRLTGVEVSDADMVRIMESLRIKTTLSEGALTCTPPADRQDLTAGADIAEEVLRVYGYDKIPSTDLTAKVEQGKPGRRQQLFRRLTALLCGAGYDECRTFSFQSAKVFDQLMLPNEHPLRRCATLLNPLGEDYAVMRTTLLGSMLQTIALNANRGSAQAYLFEISATYHPNQLPIEDELPDERDTLALGAYGKGADFYALKGAVEMLLSALGLTKNARWERGKAPYLHPGRSAALLLDGVRVCEIGEAHPDVLENFGAPARTCIGEIDLKAMYEMILPMGEAAAPPRYPAVTRDLALVMREEVPAGDVIDVIVKAAGTLLEKAELFDVYVGAPIEKGYKSAAYSLTLRASGRTLTDDEVASLFARVVSACEEHFGAKLR